MIDTDLIKQWAKSVKLLSESYGDERKNIKKQVKVKKNVKLTEELTVRLKYRNSKFPSNKDDFKFYYISFIDELGWEPWQRLNEYAIELVTNTPVLATSRSDEACKCTYYDGENEIEDASVSNSFYDTILCALGYDFLPEIDFIMLKPDKEY